ncbi:MAG: Nitrogen regulation protein NR(I) [Fluviibacter phosphoraccumulans EoVTN8]
MKSVWIVDDDQSICWVLEKALGRAGVSQRSFDHANDVINALDAGNPPPQVLISDIRMQGPSGLDMLARIKTLLPELPVIIMTAYSDLESAVTAFQGGAFEYLAKPFDIDQALALIQRAMAQSAKPTPVSSDVDGGVPEIQGHAPAMQEVFRAIGRLSNSSATVLITGESGSGKELVARALHRYSSRANKPFIAINTVAIPKDLLESELFGHERGAFTGAATQRRGRFEEADGGTLFLDEIGDMPAELQTRLLRVLSDGHYYRVGGHQSIKSNVRVIAATHQNFEERVRQGLFREDLFHRLNVIRLRLPLLKERREDIPDLAEHFLARSAKELGGEPKQLTPAAMAYLTSLPFPGNVRQLENLCHWLTVMAPGQVVDLNDLPPELREEQALAAQPDTESVLVKPKALLPLDNAGADWTEALAEVVDNLLVNSGNEAGSVDGIHERLMQSFERTLIQRALLHTGGRRIEAAQLLGIGCNTITRKIQELKLDEESAAKPIPIKDHAI